MPLKKPSILIVDDTQENLLLLTDLLERYFQVLAASNGEKAIAIAHKMQPDTILLDIMMPGLNGYEVCKILKSDPDTADIPIIFVSALSDQVDEFKGLIMGAVDYITKPINTEILLSRVNTHIQLRLAQKELLQSNKNLEELVELRTKELAETHTRLKTHDTAKQDFLSAIAHELRTPVHGVLGLAELAYTNLAKYDDCSRLHDAFKVSSSRLLQTMEDALLLTELQTSEDYLETEPLEISQLLNFALDEVIQEASDKNIRFDSTSVDEVKLPVNRQLMHSSFITLLTTAVKLAHPDTTIQLKTRIEDSTYSLRICFSGPHLSEQAIKSFFDVYSYQRSSSHADELGLNIPVASRIIEVFGGSVSIQNQDSEIVEIEIKLPMSH